jgi:hypothetical protein
MITARRNTVTLQALLRLAITVAFVIAAVLGLMVTDNMSVTALFLVVATAMLLLLAAGVNIRWFVLALIIFCGFQADYPLYQVTFEPLGSTAYARILLVDIAIVFYVWRRSISATGYVESAGKRNKRILGLPIVYLFLGLISWECLSLITATYRDVSVFQIISSMRVFAVMCVVVDYARQESQIKWVVIGLMIVFMINSGYSVIQLINGGPLGLSALGETLTTFRANIRIGDEIEGVFVSGFTGGPYSLAGYLVLLIPLLMVLALSGDFIPKLLAIFFLGFGLILLALIGSRATLVATAFELIFIYYVFFIRRRFHLRMKYRYLIGALVVILCLTAVYGERIYLRFFVSNTVDSADDRLELINAALEMGRNNPIFGIGIGNFSPIVAGTNLLFGPNGRPVHNMIMLWMAETGYAGALLLIGCWLWALLTSYRLAIKSSLPKSLRLLSIGLFSGVLGLVIHGQLDIVFRHAVVFTHYGIFLGLIGALSLIAANNRSKQRVLREATFRGETRVDRATLSEYSA